jgi:hypothetical protein
MLALTMPNVLTIVKPFVYVLHTERGRDTMTAARRFTIRPEARAEVVETHGELAANSIYALVDQCRSHKTYAPVGTDESGGIVVLCDEATTFFDDQVREELR